MSAEAIIFGKDLDSCNTDDSNDVGLQDNSGFNMVNEYSCYVILLIEIKQELKIVEIF